ncbi:fungal AP-1-like factor [Exophiala viscosa]|uniref:Fungal AP-1-like factor n=1 Tax=Exophiala viscosa TaxID=2486360 RepID=A0AAN6DQB8_9EURO|nr:fungal AP-1-like factor [Exophiala viscosa]
MSRQSTEGLLLSPEQQDLLMAALNSNQSSTGQKTSSHGLDFTPSMSSAPGSGNLNFSDESPFLDFDPQVDFGDESFDFDENARMIGDIPGVLHDKRKSIDGKDDDDERGGKRREGEDKTAKKPGRKPLTSEPTSKRKAQNRAAQRAFRERKEQHLKDLEVKVEDLEKASESTNHENGLLRAQVERLQVELKEYRKRLSWISSNGLNRSQPVVTQPARNTGNNDFSFEFPKFGDLPPMPATKLFGTSTAQKQQIATAKRAESLPTAASKSPNPSTNNRRSPSASQNQPARFGSLSQSPLSNGQAASSTSQTTQKEQHGSVDSLTGLFSPSILEASRHASMGGYFPQTTYNATTQNSRPSIENGVSSNPPGLYPNSSISNSNSDSPSSSTESQNHMSSIGTSPEPSLNSPANKVNDLSLNPIQEENQIAFGGFFNSTPGLENNGINWLAQQNNNNFDPVLFGDYRETQDNILSQDFGAFFNDAYPLPDLGSPLHNYNDIVADQQPKGDLMRQVEDAKNGDIVPDTEKPMSCNKIWDRLQSMEKFRNGEIDIDNLCSELRAKAKCSEGGAVVDRKDVDKILGTT